jgi:hypothetical protein
MGAFTDQNRDKPMWHTVAFHDVPMFRALALALDDAQDHGAKFAIFSADRRDAVIKRFNAAHHTNLHGQQYLYDHQHQPGFFAANSPSTTSHCLYSDGNPVYQLDGNHIPAGHALPDFMLGIDACDAGSTNDCSKLVQTLVHLGYSATRPYPGTGEAHHMVFTRNPVPTLRKRHRIPRSTPAGVT